MKQRLSFLLTALLLMTGLSLSSQSRTEASIDFSAQGYSNGQDFDGVVIGIDDNVTVVFNKGTGSTSPKYYNTGTAMRAYGGNNFVIASTENITSITLVFGSGDGTNEITTDVSSFDSPVWEGSSSEVTFSIGGTSGHRRIKEITVIYSTGGGQQQTVSTPTFSPAGGSYTEAQQVSISCATEGSTIYYSLDGTEPTESSSQYNVPLTISQTTTLKAKAFKSGYIASPVATATYTFPTLMTIAEARALAINEFALVEGIVNFIDGRNVYVQDATGGICLYLNNNTVPDELALGDIVQAYGKRADYNGLKELSNIIGNNPDEFNIVSSGNTLPLVVKTIAEINEGGAEALQCTRVKIEDAIIGAINTSGNTTLTQGENSINIYRVPALNGIEEGDEVNVTGVVGYFNGAQIRVATADDVIHIPTPDPELNISTNAINDFRYMVGEGPSAAKNFTVSGNNLTSDIILTAPANYELSILPSSGYFDSDELSPVNGTVGTRTIYVRLKAGLQEGEYSGNLSIVSGDLSETIALSGIVSRQPSVLTANPTTLLGFTYVYEEGGPSDIQSFLIGGDYLTEYVAVYPSESFEVSTLPGSMFRPENPALIYIPNSGHFYDINIYVRLKAGLEGGDYDEQIYAVSEGTDTLFINVSGTVTGGQPTPPEPPTPPTEGNYVRVSDLGLLTEGAFVVFAARFDDNATSYYAMNNQSSGKPTGVLFTSTEAEGNEILPVSIVDEESSYFWIVSVTSNGYTFTNANGEQIGYSASTNFATGGDNTEWSIEFGMADEGAMVPSYSGFLITNVNTNVRHFALNSNHNFGPYHTNNLNNSGYNFYLDLFVKTEGINPPTPTVATPTFTPEAGTYFEEQSVTISCATEDASIHYTVDGTDPTASSPIYSAPLTISETTTVKAFAVKEGFNDSNIAEATYTIQLGMVIIFDQDWEGEMNGWTFVTVEGDKPWTVSQYQGNHYAYANGYNGGANEQWCISPAFNIHDYQNVTLTFRNAKNYIGPDLELKYSTNYDGGDPTTANWWTFDFNMSPGSYTWVESGNIPISIYPYPAHDCHIAFKYTSTETEAAAWEVDDIMLTGLTSVPNLTVTPSALSGFTHVVGEGPSASQYFTLSGVNIGPAPGGGSTGSVGIQVSGNGFEVSLDNETFSWQVYIDGINGTLPPTPVYVRLNGEEVGQYTATVEIYASSSDEATVALSGTVTPQPVPGDDYVRISDVSQLVAGNRVIFAARFNEDATDYYAMSNTASGKPTGVLFTSAMNGSDEILPASILNEEDSFYWTVDVAADGFTFTNAAGDMIGYTSSTNFAPNGNNTAWNIEISTSEATAMVPNYTGFVITNVNNPNRAFALNGNHNFGPYHIQNMAGENYNFFLDIFMQGEGGTCTVAAPTFSPEGGTYYEAQEVTLNCSTPDATIWYSLISGNGPWIPYTEAITVEEFASIWAYAEKEGCNDSPVVNAGYVIQTDLTIIFNQDWEEDWHGWTEVSVAGDSLWRIASYQGNHYAYANGYNHPATEDWLISPAFDLDSYSDVVLTFLTAKNYNGPDIEIYFSNDYDGEDPTTATWVPLECELSTGSWTWTESGEISLDGFSGTNCYIAFKYTSTETEAAGWEVDDILLVSGGGSTEPYLVATPNALSGLTHIVEQGPSEAVTFTLTGGNFLELPGGGYGGVWLSLGDLIYSGFEISLDGEEFTTSPLTIDLDETLTLEPTTVYVRLWGNTIGSYSGSILIEEPSGVNITVSLAGEVLSANQPAISDAFMPYYIQGNNGSNNNRVPVATAVYFGNLEPNTTYRYTNQFVDANDGPETAGAGNVIYANVEGFYRSTSPSLATEGGYGEFTTDENGEGFAWFINEPTANARFTPGNHVYLRIRLNDGHDGTMVAHTFTTGDYATVLNFGNEIDEYSGSAFYAKSDEAPMTFAMMFATDDDWRPTYSTPIETTGIDYGSINQYANFYKEEVAGKDGWFGGILPNDNENGINVIWILDMDSYVINDYYAENGEWHPEANTVNPTNGLDEPIFIDLTYDGVEEQETVANVKVWSADHEFVIENGESTHFMMTVYNILGQPMMQHQINAGSTERISHSLAAGVYIIRMENNLNKVSVKVIVK